MKDNIFYFIEGVVRAILTYHPDSLLSVKLRWNLSAAF